jgi:hypothetical protein
MAVGYDATKSIVAGNTNTTQGNIDSNGWCQRHLSVGLYGSQILCTSSRDGNLGFPDPHAALPGMMPELLIRCRIRRKPDDSCRPQRLEGVAWRTAD